MKFPFALILLLILATRGGADLPAGQAGGLRDLPYKEKLSTPEFSISFRGTYPLVIGGPTVIRIETPYRASEVIFSLPDEGMVRLKKEDRFWFGKLKIFSKNEGWRPAYITIKRQVPIKQANLLDNLKDFFRIPKELNYKNIQLQKKIWVRAFLPLGKAGQKIVAIKEAPATETIIPFSTPNILSSGEAGKIEISGFPQTPTEESSLIIRGTRLFSFNSKSLEGTKEGYLPGINREESLRVNVSGKVADTDVNANFFSTSVMGTTTSASQEQKISILLKRASTEAYFGDFTADLSNTEFARINKRLSGVKISGNYDLPEKRNLSFTAIASNPQGESELYKVYGNGTQGPYSLQLAPVVIESDRIYVDGTPQKRGDDYEIDYQAGTVTFKKRVIIKTSIIEVYYDYRSTLFGHGTYGGRLSSVIYEGLKVGLSYINDSDSLKDAQNIFSSETEGTLEPQSYYLMGMDFDETLFPLLSAKGEFAYSEKKPFLISNPNFREIGKAAKLETVSTLGPITLKTEAKRITPLFTPPSEALPKQDLFEYKGFLSYNPFSWLDLEGYYGKEKYKQDGTEFNNSGKTANLKLSLPRLPSLQYLHDELTESNDPVAPYTPFNRLTLKDSYSSNYSIGFITFSGQAEEEKRISRSPIEEATIYKTANVGISTVGLEFMTLSLNLELKKTYQPDGTIPYTKTYNLNFSANPTRKVLTSISLNNVEDSVDGITNVTDFMYKADLNEKFKTDGKLTITSVKETFGSSLEGVLKSVASVKLEFRPIPLIRLRYFYLPNFTEVIRTHTLSYNNENQQYEVNLLPSSSLMLGATLKTTTGFVVDKTDYPNYSRINSSSKSTSQIYALKAAPKRFLSCELNYLMDDARESNLQDANYLKTNSNAAEINTTIRTSLSEKIAFDLSYTNRITKSGTGEVLDNISSNLSETAAVKGYLNLTDSLTFTASYAYSEQINLLISENSKTYSLSPSLGFTYRWGEIFRMEGNYTYSKAYASSSQEKTLLALNAKYDISEFLHLFLKGARETSLAPDYKTTDISGNIEIDL